MAEGAIKNTGDFLGISKFGQGIGAATRVLTGEVGADIARQNQNSERVGKLLYAAKRERDPEKRTRLLKLAQGLGTGTSALDIDQNLNLSNREILGSGANIALNIATPGAFRGGKLAVVGKNAALGGAFGTASGLEKGRSAQGVVGSAIGGALVGSALGSAALVMKGTKDFVTRTTPSWLMDKAVRPSLNELRKNVKFGTKTLGQELLEEGVKGGPQKLLEIADNELVTLEGELQSILTSRSLTGTKINRNSLFPYVRDAIKAKQGTPGLAGEAKKIEGVWKSLPDNLSLVEANEMKRRIYNELRDPAYRLDAKLTARSQALKGIARGLKEQIEKSVGGNVVKDINRKLSIYGRMESAIVDQLARDLRNNSVGLTDAILIAGGEVGPKGFLAAIIKNTLGSTGFQTRTADILKRGQKIGTGRIGEAAKGAARRATLNLP